jgi:hypothetical protein
MKMALNDTMRLDSVAFGIPQTAIEEQIHKEFQDAFDELERASEKVDAAARLNRVVRRLFDFVGYGKMPTDLQFKRPDFPLAYAWEFIPLFEGRQRLASHH